MKNSIETLLKQWSGESTIIHYEHPSGAWIIIAVHSSKLGPASGGTRMKHYDNLATAIEDAHNLALSMTYKFAVAGLNRGGGKAVIALPPEFDPQTRPNLLRHYGTLIHQLGGYFSTGPDVGTSPPDMDTIAETGGPHVFCRTEANGGSGDTGEPSAIGVFSGIQAVCEHLFGNPSTSGKRILVQGVGSVGGHLIDLLQDDGAEILFNDVNPDLITHFRNRPGLTFIESDNVIATPCHIFAPCALGGILNADTIPHLNCQAIAGAANNQLAAPTDAEQLHERGILYAPDYVINIGGAMSAVSQELEGLSRSDAYERIKSVRQTLNNIFTTAQTKNITPSAAAHRLAEARLKG